MVSVLAISLYWKEKAILIWTPERASMGFCLLSVKLEKSTFTWVLGNVMNLLKGPIMYQPPS